VIQRFFIVYEVEPETPEGFVAVDLTLVGITRPETPLYSLDPVLHGPWYVVSCGPIVIRQEDVESLRRLRRESSIFSIYGFIMEPDGI
jgi:hypothetical protein